MILTNYYKKNPAEIPTFVSKSKSILIHYHECISKNRRKNDKLQMDDLCDAIFCYYS